MNNKVIQNHRHIKGGGVQVIIFGVPEYHLRCPIFDIIDNFGKYSNMGQIQQNDSGFKKNALSGFR